MSLTPEHILEHGPFLRGLARSLLRDAASADDVVQEAWMAALRRPQEARDLRPWLVGVVRNLVRREKRTSVRRQTREQQANTPRTGRDPVDVIETEEARRRLVEALLALDEPYRTPLLLRFYDDLPPREIARRLGVPGSTVRTRIQRGLEQLRAKLDANHGGERRAWCLAILPLALDPRAGAAVAGSVFTGAVSMKIQVSVVVLAICACVFLFLEFGEADAPMRGQPIAHESTGAAAVPPDTLAAPPVDREPPPTSEATAVVSLRGRVRIPGAESAQVSVIARATSASGEPIGEPLQTAVTTDRDFKIELGSFFAGDLPEQVQVSFAHALAETQTRSLNVRLDPKTRTPVFEPLQVTLRRVSVARGLVHTESGEPAAGVAVVAFRMDGEEPATDAVTSGTTESDGSFELRVPGEGPHLMVAVAPGFRPRGIRIEVALDAPTTLEPLSLIAGESLSGRVTLLGGGAIPGAEVRAKRRGEGSELFVPDGEFILWYSEGVVEYRSVSTRTRRDGSYEVGGLSGAHYTVELMSIPDAHHGLTAAVAGRAPGYAVEAQAPSRGVDFEAAVATIDVLVRGAGKPLDGARLTLTQHKRSSKGSSNYSNTLHVPATGQARVLVTPNVDLTLRVEADGVRPQKRKLQAPAAGLARELVFDMEPTAYGSLRITLDPLADPAPPAPPSMNIILRPLPDGDVAERQSTLEDGMHVVSDIEPGRYAVTVSAGRAHYHFPVTAEITVQPNGALPLTLRPRVGGRLHVLYVTADGRTDRSAFVRIVFPNGESSNDLRITKDDGSNSSMWSNSLPDLKGPGMIARVFEPGVYRVILEPYEDDSAKLEREVRIEAGRTIVAEFRE